MTQALVPRTETVTKPRGKPFAPGNNANPAGRPRKGNSIRDLLRSVPVAKKRELIAIAFEEAIENRDVHWAEWIARHSGESDLGAQVAEALVLVRYVTGDDGNG